MELNIKTQFNIGQIVKFKGAIQRFIINNIMAETCPGGTQILYKGAILAPARHLLMIDGKNKWAFEKDMAINENLLEALPEESNETADMIADLRKKVADKQALKNAAIKAQDFEKASSLRDEERLLRAALDDLEAGA